MFSVVIITVILIGLRLAGNTSSLYKDIVHIFIGAIGSWSWLTHEWLTILCFILLCLTEGYMVLVRFFPALSIGNLLKLTPPKAK